MNLDAGLSEELKDRIRAMVLEDPSRDETDMVLAVMDELIETRGREFVEILKRDKIAPKELIRQIWDFVGQTKREHFEKIVEEKSD